MLLSISVAKFFEMNRKQCKEALDLYKKFVTRMEGVEKFFKVAEVSLTSVFCFVFSSPSFVSKLFWGHERTAMNCWS